MPDPSDFRIERAIWSNAPAEICRLKTAATTSFRLSRGRSTQRLATRATEPGIAALAAWRIDANQCSRNGTV
jgi:hypothetical protein